MLYGIDSDRQSHAILAPVRAADQPPPCIAQHDLGSAKIATPTEFAQFLRLVVACSPQRIGDLGDVPASSASARADSKRQRGASMAACKG